MEPGAGTRLETTSAARLLIHSKEGRDPAASQFETALLRLRERYSAGRPPPTHAPLVLEVRALNGQPLVTIDDAGTTTELVLPAGTYHVTALHGSLRRGYTMTLAPGASVELHLRLVAQRH